MDPTMIVQDSAHRPSVPVPADWVQLQPIRVATSHLYAVRGSEQQAYYAYAGNLG